MLEIKRWPKEAQDQKEILARAGMVQDAALMQNVSAIVEDVRARGDKAVRDYTARFDKVDLGAFLVSEEDAQEALDRLSPDLRDALELAKKNISAFHEAQRPAPVSIETMQGVRCEMQWRAIENVGLYVPGGTAPLFSAVLMLAVPAVLAGCRRIVLCAPPQKDGRINAETLAAARLCGIKEIFTVGGAQAIAAMAYGTQTVPKVDKIMGPGNAYVTMAKQLVAQGAGGAAIDMPAGPSEVMVIAGAAARANWVAADLLAQAEHDTLSQAVLVTDDEAFAKKVRQEILAQKEKLPRRSIVEESLAQSRIILSANEDEAIEIANLYAPEHLIIHGAKAENLVPRVQTAGSVFVGDFTPETAGDYASGTNHVLPTYGAARAYGGLSLYSFLRTMTVQSLSDEGLRALAPALVAMAEAEGLEAHAAAVRTRLKEIPACSCRKIRAATLNRKTKETNVNVFVDLDRASEPDVQTGIGFLDHMLDQLAAHGGFSLVLRAKGDLHVDNHHTVEDCALALGEAMSQALGDKKGLARFGFTAPLDESVAEVVLDLSGRPFAKIDIIGPSVPCDGMGIDLVEHFFRSFASALGATLHITARGENNHHVIEASFKALGRALRQALRREGNALPSTKGVL